MRVTPAQTLLGATGVSDAAAFLPLRADVGEMIYWVHLTAQG